MIGKRGRNLQWASELMGRRRSPSKSMMFLAAGISFLALLLWGSAPALAQEAVSEDTPTPSSVDEMINSIDRLFKKEPPREKPVKPIHPFFRDQKLDLNLRTYYLYKDKFDDSKSEAWAAGGALRYKSGYLFDHVGMGAAVYTSQPIYAPAERDGTLLLAPGGDEYTVLGQLYGEIKVLPDNFFRFYRQEYDTPYINKNDNRMTPNTFEGYSFQGAYGGKDGTEGLRYGAGYVTKIKDRNSDTFTWMSQDAGAKVERGVSLAGLRFFHGPFAIAAIDYYSVDLINIFYTEGKYVFQPTKELGLLVSAQYTDQQSVGKNYLTGNDFYTNQFGIKGDMSYRRGILTLAYTAANTGANLQNPWSSYPGYTSVQVQDFNRAGENAFMAKLSYDFRDLGLAGVTAYALWVHGWGAVNPSTGASVYQQDEYDLDLQWRPQIKVLKGLWFRTRYAYVDQRDGGTASQSDFRIIVNYDVAVF